MATLEDFEREHAAVFVFQSAHAKSPEGSFKTPDGHAWNLPAVIAGWQPRTSDQWAWATLHGWIARGLVLVKHVELPYALAAHEPTDPVWQFIERLYGPCVTAPEHAMIGRADLGNAFLMVEIGTCAPAKFVINLGTELCDHMIVPFDSRYAFVFTPTALLIQLEATRLKR